MWTLFLDYRQIPDIDDEKPLPVPKNAALLNFTFTHNAELAYRRYIGLNFWVPTIQKGPRIGRKIFYLAMKDWRAPFDRDFKGHLLWRFLVCWKPKSCRDLAQSHREASSVTTPFKMANIA